MNTRLKNDRRLTDIVEKILKVDTPEKIMLFGSRAKGIDKSRSDFDIALFGSAKLAKIYDNLQEAETLLNIDLVSFEDIKNNKLKSEILENGVILYERKV